MMDRGHDALVVTETFDLKTFLSESQSTHQLLDKLQSKISLFTLQVDMSVLENAVRLLVLSEFPVQSRLLSLFVGSQYHIFYQTACESAFKFLIKKKTIEQCEELGDDTLMDTQLRNWFDEEMSAFIRMLYPGEAVVNAMWTYLMDSYCRVRSQSLFDMISDFPDSMSRIMELRSCAAASNDLLGFIGSTFRNALQCRLLHMGASTTQILDQYVRMIKALRLLDPSDLLLDYVSGPVRVYLRGRKDAVRCIVESLTEDCGSEGESDLQSELRTGGSLAYAADEDDEESGPGGAWLPVPTIKDLSAAATTAEQNTGGRGGSSGRGMDVLSSLVSIYGSTDLFIAEYRALLADRLLTSLSVSADREVATMELLKIRFGEDSLHNCEVMLKDHEDAGRHARAVHGALRGAPRPASDAVAGSCVECATEAVDFAVISSNYWPKVPAADLDNLSLHPVLDREVRRFCETFEALKKPRRLHPISRAGIVELDLAFADGAVRSFKVSPLQASVVSHVSDQSRVSLAALVTLCGEVADEDVLYAATFWVSKGVVSRSGGSSSGEAGGQHPSEVFYSVQEDQAAHMAGMQDEGADNDADDDQYLRIASTADSLQKVSLEEMERYVKNMLATQGPLPLERVHAMLRMLMGAGGADGFDMSVPDLRRHLERMADGGHIEAVNGLYSRRQG